MTRKQKKTLARIIIAAVLLLAAALLERYGVRLWLPDWLGYRLEGLPFVVKVVYGPGITDLSEYNGPAAYLHPGVLFLIPLCGV